MAKLRKIRAPRKKNGAAEPERERSQEEILYPERFVRLLDGSTAIIEPWSYIQGREMMNEVLGGFVEKYNLLDPDKPAFQLFEMAQDDLMRMVQLHCGYTNEQLAKLSYEDALVLAEGVWIVNAEPILAKSFRLVRSLAGLVPRRTLEKGSPSPSSSSSPTAIRPTQ